MANGDSGSSDSHQKQWTLLAYMAGDNNLTEEMVWSLQEMKKTLEANGEINKRVGVVAQYDARGLNPCLLFLNSAGKGADGKLDKQKKREYGSRNVFDQVRGRLTPTPEHRAIAMWHYHHQNPAFQKLISFVTENCGMSQAQAEQFVIDLIMCDVAVRQQVFADGEKLALALADAKTKLLAPNDEELMAARAVATPTLRRKIQNHVNALNLGALEQVKAVLDLAGLLARSSDSIFRNTRDLSSPLMIQEFIEGRVELIKKNKLDASHYIVVLSGHGGGATGDFLPDEDPPSSLTIPKLGEILREALKASSAVIGKKKLDILGIDSCLMSMAEVGYEVQDSVEYLVGSEGFVANTGWPYHRVLEVLAANSTPASVAESLVEKYAAFYQDYEMGGVSTHLAAIRLDAIRNPESKCLATAVKLLADHLIHALKNVGDDAEQQEVKGTAKNTPGRTVRDAVVLAHWYAQSFKWEKYVDLWDFCSQLSRFLPQADGYATKIRRCCKAVQRSVDQAVLRSCYCGPEFQHTRGISVYFPWSAQDFSIEYKSLSFACDTGWYDFLDIYLQKTRKLRRGHDEITRGEPWRLGSDVEQMMHRVGSPYASRVGSPYASRVGSPYASRVGSPYASRVGSPYASRVGSPYASKMQDGKVVFQTGFKNVPDGFFRQDSRGKFVAKKA